jgi:nitrite reductase/ring-hydroxylating ferredoxin subunit
MAEFLETIPLDRLPPGKAKVVRVAGKDVALFNVEGKIYAMDDTCAHAGCHWVPASFGGPW